MASYNITANLAESSSLPLPTQAILFPLFAFPAWILCVPSLVWHFSQGNIAAGSVVTWIVLNNFYNAINALIWPRDNITEWWDGNVWCDIGIRIQVGTTVGIASSTVMIIRKLARVMDTRNIIVSSSKNSRVKEKIWEVAWCWGYPLLMVLLFYIVQPIRYFIFGIIGCISGYDTSWPSIVLSIMWGPITMLVATYYAVLLIYRLYVYRREFHRLISARNTTKSRFVRLFILCIITVVAYTPYTIYLLVNMCAAITDPYDWDRIHGPSFNDILKVPVFGKVTMEKWIQVATGYVIFFVYGTGIDAHNLYKKMLIFVGLGKFFPRLYIMDSGSSTPSSFIAARSWSSSMSSKAKSVFWSKSGSQTETIDSTTITGSVRHNRVIPLHTMAGQNIRVESTKPSLLKRMFGLQRQQCNDVLPLYSREDDQISVASVSRAQPSSYTSSQGVEAHAWAVDDPAPPRISGTNRVHVSREIYQDCCDKDDVQKESKPSHDWA